MTSISVIEDNVEITTSYSLSFMRKNGMGGFGFGCDSQGNVDEFDNPLAAENYLKCLSGEHDCHPPTIQTYVNRYRLCSCGSGESPEQIYDARGIFVASCCDQCKELRTRGYRLEIFEDPNYECDEQIDEDY